MHRYSPPPSFTSTHLCRVRNLLIVQKINFLSNYLRDKKPLWLVADGALHGTRTAFVEETIESKRQVWASLEETHIESKRQVWASLAILLMGLWVP